MPNTDIKNLAKSNGVKMWQIADALHIQDSALSRKMRYALPENERMQIVEIIKKISMQKGEAHAANATVSKDN